MITPLFPLEAPSKLVISTEAPDPFVSTVDEDPRLDLNLDQAEEEIIWRVSKKDQYFSFIKKNQYFLFINKIAHPTRPRYFYWNMLPPSFLLEIGEISNWDLHRTGLAPNVPIRSFRIALTGINYRRYFIWGERYEKKTPKIDRFFHSWFWID